MLRSSNSLPHRLDSVALRYRHALARRGAASPSGRPGHLDFEAPSIAKDAARSEFLRDDKLARVEAVLFAAQEPLSTRKIAQVASLADATEARTLIRRLNRYYDSQASAFRAEQVAGGYQLLTRSRFGGWLRRWRQTPAESRLSGPAMETLAVVAYRQPVVRGEIEAIRGVQCGEILRQLMDRDLVRIVGRTQELGRPFVYGTTRRFLQWSGLGSLDELPRADALRRAPDEPSHETSPAARRDDELNPRNDLNEEPEVKIVASPESALNEPWTIDPDALADRVGLADRDRSAKPWTLAAESLQAQAEEDEDVEDDDFDDDDDYDDDDDDDDLDDDEDLDDEDLEDEEWEEVDDEDDWDDEDEDWDEDDDEDDDEDWDEE